MKYFLGFLITIGLVIGVIILVIHGFKGSTPKQVQTPLVDYASTNRTAELLVRGPLSTDDKHYAIHLTVGRDQSSMEVLHGYNESIQQTYTYSNNQAAYAEFLRALDLAGFTKGNKKASQDDRGYCINGRRYIFELKDGGDAKEHYWAASCGGGNFAGNLDQVKAIFLTQIPDFNKVAPLISL